MLRQLATLLVLSLLCRRAPAETLPLSLRGAVALAVRQNPALQSAGAELAAAEASVLSARGLDDLVLSASTAFRATGGDERREQPLPPLASEQVDGSLQLTQPLSIGGRVTLELQATYSRAPAPAPLDAMLAGRSTSEEYAPALQLRIDQPLLRGAGVGVARAERRRAGIGRDLAAAQREGLAAALVRDVIGGYWGLAHSQRELEIRRAAAGAAREQLARVRANISVGKLPPSATAEIEVAIALREDAVLLAEQAVTERELTLGRLCAVPVNDRVASVEPLPELDLGEAPEPALALALEAALARNPQLEAARAQARAGAVELEVTENGLLPQLDLSLAGGPVARAADAGAAYEQLTAFASYAVSANLAFSAPLARHAARGARDLARERLRTARLDAADIAAQIRAAVAQAVAARDTSRRRTQVLVPSQAAAALDLEAERARFDVGRASNFDVLRRQDALAVVQLLLLGAQLAELEASASLDALTGQILEQNGVTLRGTER